MVHVLIGAFLYIVIGIALLPAAAYVQHKRLRSSRSRVESYRVDGATNEAYMYVGIWPFSLGCFLAWALYRTILKAPVTHMREFLERVVETGELGIADIFSFVSIILAVVMLAVF